VGKPHPAQARAARALLDGDACRIGWLAGDADHYSTIITTNLVYDEWPNVLGNRPMVEALLSRLRHYCHTVHIDGPSLRPPQS
jgi:hypothetical protein